MERETIATEFELQVDALHYRIKERQGLTYKVTNLKTGKHYTALVEVESFDFFEQRHFLQNLSAPLAFDLLIVARHNAYCPVRVLSLADGHEYGTLEAPPARAESKRWGEHEAKRFLSWLLLGSKGAYDELNRMKRARRYRYLQRKESYMRRRVGRPRMI